MDGVTIAVTVALAAQFPKVVIDTDPKHMLPVTSPVRQYNDQVERDFALHPDVIAVGIVNERGIVNRETLSRVIELTRAIQKMPGVVSRDVTSFTTIDDVTVVGSDLVVRPLLDRIPESDRLSRLGELCLRRAKVIAVGGGACLAVAGVGLARIQVNNNMIHWFRPESEVRTADRVLNARLGGTSTAYLVIDGGTADAMKAPAMLRGIGALQRELERDPRVGKTFSVSDYVKRINRIEQISAGAGASQKTYPTITKRTMKNVQSGHRTEVTYSNVAYDLGLDDGVFAERALQTPPLKWMQ